MKKEIYIWGYLHQCGGAGPEAGHIIELLRFNDYEVICVLVPGTDVLSKNEPRRKYFDGIGVRTEEYRPGMLDGKVLWCWCQDEVFRYLALSNEKPAVFAYWPCMNWLTEKELVGLSMFPTATILCQSNFQKSKIDQLVGAVVGPILPAVQAVQARGVTGDAVVDAAARDVVMRGVQALRTSQPLQQRLSAGQLRVVGAFYDLDSGKVEFLGTPR